MKIAECNVVANVAVKDLAEGKKFYGETLGLKVDQDGPAGVAYSCGSGTLFVYEAPSAGSGQATCATWQVEGIEDVVKELANKGVKFEHYDMPGAQWQGDVATMGNIKAAWFKDPSGNILGLSQM